MRFSSLVLLVGWLAGGLGGSGFGGEAAAKFTKKPRAMRSGAGAKIEFAVDRATDVAVFIENGKGEVVRHLVAGVLGKNPPKPLKPGLAQSVTWDGKADYGKPAGSGPFRVRVALGMRAGFDKVLAGNAQNFKGGFAGIKSLAVDRSGTLYVCHEAGDTIPNWFGERIVALGRDGKYLRTILPWPANIKKEALAGHAVHVLDGRPVPLPCGPISKRSYASDISYRSAGMAITADGVILRPVSLLRKSPYPRLSAIRTDGGAGWGREEGPDLLGKGETAKKPWLAVSFKRPHIAVSGDGRWAYLAGLVHPKTGPLPAVYRAKLPERADATPFFGDPAIKGKDRAQLGGQPAGLAVDGKGHLLIADSANNRVVVVSESKGACIAEFKVEKPDALAVNQKTGAVYVTSLASKRAARLIKLSGWKNPREVASLPIVPEGPHPWKLALDFRAEPPLIWLGGDQGTLLRVEDRGGKFASRKVSSEKFHSMAFTGIEVDRYGKDREVYWRCDKGGGFYRYSEADDKTVLLPRPKTHSASGMALLPGPDGNLYGLSYPYSLLRFSRDGKPLPWPKGNMGYPANNPWATKYRGGKTEKMPHGIYVPVPMGFVTHTLGIRHDGHPFVFEQSMGGGRDPKKLMEYLPAGKRASGTPVIWKVSETAVGPKFDQQGNIYIAEQIKPIGKLCPPEFKSVVGPAKVGDNAKGLAGGARDAILTMYGSIVKFSPKGGMIHFPGKNPFKGEPKLDASLKTDDAVYCQDGKLRSVKITGAEWIRMGVSHVALHYCNCETTRFDVDEFGRVWYPDLGRFRVCVLDTNGNDITHFGGYGNSESAGPGSLIPKPEIAFSWLIGVGVTEKYVYTADSLNRRLLRAKVTYSREERCEIK